jgi:hypothetical protein
MSEALRDLRRTRRQRRLGDVEWFDIAYKVYLSAFFGGAAVIIASDWVGDEPATTAQIATAFDRGPALLGLAGAAALAFGVRSGAEGGPLSLEAADVRHLLLAPIDRRAVLLRPTLQRIRAIAGIAALTGGVGGLLASQRLPGSATAWITSGAVAGAVVGVLFVAAAVVTHARRMPRWLATVIGVIAATWQALAIVDPGGTDVRGPFDTLGSLAMWGDRQHPVDLAVPALTAVVAGLALWWCGQLRPEPMVRRGDLVSQLRFAVTTQDLRTVVLLRRQMRNEQFRSRHWFPVPHPGAGNVVWARGWRGLSRFPLARFGRMAALAIAAGVAAAGVQRDITPLVVLVGLALFFLGLEAIEPLSQEIDHPDRTDAISRPLGWVLVRHLAAPAMVLVPFAAIGAAAATVFDVAGAATAFALAVPMVWGGAIGAVVTTVRDRESTISEAAAMMPPEFVGFGTVVRTAFPMLLSVGAALPAIAVREAPGVATVVRCVAALALAIAACAWWVRRGREWRAKAKAFLDAGRAAT